MRASLALAVALALSACSASDPSTSEATTTPTVSVAEACQSVADELPAGSLPDPAQWEAYGATLRDLAAPEGLLDDLRAAVEGLTQGRAGADLLEDRRALRDALDELDAECQTAGSDALE